MKTSKKGIDLIISFESVRLEAYKDPIGIWTIGIGATYYEDGSKVKQGDKISQERAIELFQNTLKRDFEPAIRRRVTADINQNQFDALVSFVFNCGEGNFKKSTLLKRINANPNDPNIELEFAKWCKSGGKVLTGLVRRRKAESDLYFKK